MTQNLPRLALFYGRLGGGGAERMLVNIARGFVERGFPTDLVLSRAGGSHMWLVPPDVRVVDLQSSGTFHNVPKLINYLKRELPYALLTTTHYANEIALWAKRLSRVPTKIIVREANHLSQLAQYESNSGYRNQLRYRLMPWLARSFYPWADGVVAVSQGVAEDLTKITNLSLKQIKVIYNPTITPELAEKAQKPVEHPWFVNDAPPVILGAGKLHPQKDFPTLIRAFAKVRQIREARLVILGWGKERSRLEALAEELGLSNEIDFLDHVKNPYAYMAKADVFVLSSAWEGLPNVLIEALAVGVPVVATDCPSGPREILHGGQYGWLTPVANPQAMAEAILKVLDGEVKLADAAWLDQFTLQTSVQKYLDLLKIPDSDRDYS